MDRRTSRSASTIQTVRCCTRFDHYRGERVRNVHELAVARHEWNAAIQTALGNQRIAEPRPAPIREEVLVSAAIIGRISVAPAIG
jgi:hypothetical protein